MFGFPKSKKPRRAQKSAGAQLEQIVASTSAYKDVDAMFMGGCVEHALKRFSQTGRFQGAYQDLAQFKCMTMPEGIEVAGSETKGASAILAETVISISQVGAGPLHWSSIAVDTYLRIAVGQCPDWKITDEGHMVATHAFTPEIEVAFTAKPDQAIDPTWAGERLSGATLLMQVRSVPPAGGMH